MNRFSPKRRSHSSEDGYVLVAVIFMATLLVLSLAIAVPKVREDIQRDRDEETMQRGKQYIRAVRLYYRKFHAYPPSVDALVKTNDIRFLRKKYVDPTTGKDEWKAVQFGQNKVPIAMGFFGQPLAGTTVAGIGPSGGNGATNTTSSGGLFNTPTTTTSPTTGSGQGSTTDANGNPIGGTAASPTGIGQTGTSQSSSAFGSSNNPTGSGQSFGGAGIIGFSPQSPKQSVLIFKKKNHYNEWEFTYDPIMEQQAMGGGNTGTVGQPASSTTTPVGSSTSPMTPTTPTTPTSQANP